MGFEYSKEGRVALFTINRPEARNAFSTHMLHEMHEAMVDFRIDAEKAERIGLVNEVVLASELMSTARKWAERICRAGPLAVRAAKEAMIRGYNLSLNDGVRLENALLSYLVGTEDFAEGIKAFGEKRRPVYEGK